MQQRWIPVVTVATGIKSLWNFDSEYRIFLYVVWLKRSVNGTRKQTKQKVHKLCAGIETATLTIILNNPVLFTFYTGEGYSRNHNFFFRMVW
jgi:hypothetical protein